MSSYEDRVRGFENERRALNCLKGLGTNKPYWFGKALKACPEMDKRGVDILVVIKSRNKRKKMRRWCVVPLQIKSSITGKDLFCKTHLLHHKARVPVIVAADFLTAEELRSDIFKELEKVREIADTFGDFMRFLLGRKKIKTARKSQWRAIRKSKRRRERDAAIAVSIQAAE